MPGDRERGTVITGKYDDDGMIPQRTCASETLQMLSLATLILECAAIPSFNEVTGFVQNKIEDSVNPLA